MVMIWVAAPSQSTSPARAKSARLAVAALTVANSKAVAAVVADAVAIKPF
jgi:hypothetical protein